MDKIYRLDLLTLIESLQQQSATLTAELPAGLVPGVFEECKGFVRLQNGEITKSAIIGKSGPQVSGPDALRYLHSVDRWLVKLEQEKGDTHSRTSQPLAPSSQPLAPYTPLPPSPQAPGQDLFTAQQHTPSNGMVPFPQHANGQGVFTPPPESWYPQVQFPPPSPPIPVPRQRMPLLPELLDRLSHRERMVFRLVYTMVNGHRSIDQIKEQLHLSEETIDHALEELRKLGVIDW